MRPMLIAFDLDGTLVEDHLIDVPCTVCEGDRVERCGTCERCRGTGTRLAPRTDREFTDPALIPQAVARLGELTPYANHFAIVTNQGGVALGYQTEDEVKRRISRSLELLHFFDGQSFSIHYCVHHPYAKAPGYRNPSALDLARRKPNSGMLVEAMEPGGWPFERSVYIGDRDTDRQAAEGVMLFLDAEQWWGEGITLSASKG